MRFSPLVRSVVLYVPPSSNHRGQLRVLSENGSSKLVGGKHPRRVLHYPSACGIIIATPEERTWDGHPTCAGAGETDLRLGPSSPSQSKGPRLRFWSNLEPLNEP